MVITELGGELEGRGIPPEELARKVLRALGKDKYEIPIGEAHDLVTASKREWENIFQHMNQW